MQDDPWTRTHTLAVDFDGVIHQHDLGWRAGELYGDVIAGAVAALESLQNAGYTIVIHSVRAGTPTARANMRVWMGEHGFKNVRNIKITNKKPPAIAYIDDRAVRFTNWVDMTKVWV